MIRSAFGPRHAAAALGVAALLTATVAAAAPPGSGDVDGDGRVTTRDALMIYTTLGQPSIAYLPSFLSACDVNGDGVCDTTDALAILTASMVSPADYDGDGVPNEQDCNPLDERIAVPHTYFFDYDQDHYGDPANTIQLCTVEPPEPAVVWGNDPDDTTPFGVPLFVPKGSRLLGLDFSDPAEDGRWRGDLSQELGAEAAPLTVGWNTLETSPGVFTAGVTPLDIANLVFPQRDLRASLTVGPITGGVLTLPDDLKSAVESGRMRLNDPVIVNRFTALLAWIHGRMPAVSLVSIQLGDGVDQFLVRAPAYFWSDYGEFIRAVSAQVRTLWPGVPVGFTATQAGLVDPSTADLLASLNSLADVVSVSYRPHTAEYFAIDPAQVRSDVERVIARYYPKPIYFQSIAYPSAPVTGSSEVRQSQFLYAFFDVWDRWAAQIPYAAFGRLSDESDARAQFEAIALGGAPSAAVVAYIRSLGLRTFAGAGADKAAYRTLRTLAFNRGWWRIPPATTRSFGLGFVPSLYDFPSDPASYEAMLDWLEQTIATDGSTTNLHLDNGVPWVEALQDTFTSAELPYSPAMQAMWSSLKAHVPSAQKLLVSLNPLGVPRNVIAPYFGVGQGFTYDASFTRVPDGIVKDAENRMPPAPWDTYALDDPHVKQAYFNYCKRAVQYFSPDYLIVAIEITATMNESPAAYAQLMDLLTDLRARLKADPTTAAVPIGVSISATSFMTDEFGIALKHEEEPPLKRELQVEGFREVTPLADFFGLSLYPHYGKYNANVIPASMFDSLTPLLEAAGKPVAVTESGFPAESFTVITVPFISDPDKQDRFYKLMFYELQKMSVPVWFAVNFEPRDADEGWQRLLAGSQQQPPTVSPQFVEFYKYFRNIGLYDGEGNQRAATRTWKSQQALPYAPKER